MSLLAHCTTNYVSRDQVINIQTPPFTETWHPIAHSDILTSLETAIHENGNGLSVTKEDYSLSTNGANMFGVWHLNQRINGMASTIGIRNSIDKSFALGICSGTNVFVCDNLAFSGEFIEFKRHTKGLTIESLQAIFHSAIPQIVEDVTMFNAWHLRLKEIELSFEDFKVLTYESFIAGVTPPSKFMEFTAAYRSEHDRTLFGFHGAVTRLLRNKPLQAVSMRSAKAKALIDDFMVAKNYISIPESNDIIIDGKIIKPVEFIEPDYRPIDYTEEFNE